MLNTIFKKLLPAAALGMGLAVSGCDGMNISIGDTDGVPLAELDMSGDAPSGLVVAGPDTVIVTEGETLAIDVEGDASATEDLRFTLEDGTLGVTRESSSWSDTGTAIVRVTMPLPKELVIAGSGKAELPGMASSAEVTIAGSGTATIAALEVEDLELSIAGSGQVETSGTAKSLNLNIAGSGSGKMAGLKVDTADISIAGSGEASFASDGTVKASVVGSGDVTVTGRAKCTIDAVGSGSLKCEEAPAAATEEAADAS